MKTTKIIGRIFYWLVILAVIFFGISIIFSNTKTKAGYQLFVVQSGSMEPSIRTGSLVLVIPQKEYKQGDIITFWESGNQKNLTSTVTHRIVSVKKEENKVLIQTKGDANPAVDKESISPEMVLGKVTLIVPSAGRAVAFAKTQNGFFIFIVIPAVLIVYSELMNIKGEIKKMIEDKAKQKEEEEKERNEELKKFILEKPLRQRNIKKKAKIKKAANKKRAKKEE